MFERLTENQFKIVRNCAEAVHSIENGTANQVTVNSLLRTSYFFTVPEDGWEKNIMGVDEAKKENSKGNYNELIEIVSYKFPEVNKAYLPFLIADILREVYWVSGNV